ncbi:DUF4386 domain-containing protein [Flavihumibacter sp. R14]|nr:DUF4386 domain-containing protein [Flavihumibacter soli]
MSKNKTIALLLILGAIGVMIPYSILTITFDYPDILREASGTILTKFHDGGAALILTWLAFALLGLPLLVAYSMIGHKLEDLQPSMRWVTTVGIISVVVQLIGLLRWVFVVPVLATDYITATDPASREAAIVGFKVIHQFGGVLLGEHLGQLFTIIWTVFTAAALQKEGIIPKWLAYWAYIASLIYLLAQAELLDTVIPRLPVIGIAGFLGSTLWLVWIILVGIRFLGQEEEHTETVDSIL